MHGGTPSLRFTDAQFVDSVAAWHGGNSSFNWADGHADNHRWQDSAAETRLKQRSDQIFQLVFGSCLRLHKPRATHVLLANGFADATKPLMFTSQKSLKPTPKNI